jgi:Arc/MetJ-type ribon-helix-helix transcriptional regulator
VPEPRVTIKIPRPLYERIRKSIEGSGFSSVTDFIVFVLRDLMMTEGAKGKKKEIAEGELTREELEAIRKRLESLGYL